MNERVEGDVGFKRCGSLYLADSDQGLEAHGKWLEYAEPFGIDTGLITAAEVAKHLPGSSHAWHGALYCPTDGKAETLVAAPAIARCAQKRGDLTDPNSSTPTRRQRRQGLWRARREQPITI